MASKSEHSWIMDTGATNHMVSIPKMLSDLSDYTKNGTGTMHLLDGKQLPIRHVSRCSMEQGILVMYCVFLTSSLICY